MHVERFRVWVRRVTDLAWIDASLVGKLLNGPEELFT